MYWYLRSSHNQVFSLSLTHTHRAKIYVNIRKFCDDRESCVFVYRYSMAIQKENSDNNQAVSKFPVFDNLRKAFFFSCIIPCFGLCAKLFCSWSVGILVLVSRKELMRSAIIKLRLDVVRGMDFSFFFLSKQKQRSSVHRQDEID